MSEFQFGGEFVWHPSPELIAQSNLQSFINRHDLGSFDELMRRSTSDISWFWDTVLRDLGIEFYKPHEKVVDLSKGKATPQWCVGGEMNIVHNLLDKYAGTAIDKKIVIAILAIIKIGGIFLPLFSGFGVSAIVYRLKDADGKALFTADGTFRRGKFCAMRPIAEEAAAQVPTLKHLIVLTKNSEWVVA